MRRVGVMDIWRIVTAIAKAVIAALYFLFHFLLKRITKPIGRFGLTFYFNDPIRSTTPFAGQVEPGPGPLFPCCQMRGCRACCSGA